MCCVTLTETRRCSFVGFDCFICKLLWIKRRCKYIKCSCKQLMCFRRPCQLQTWSCGRRCVLSYLTLVLTPVRALSSVGPLRRQDSYLTGLSSAGEMPSVRGWFERVGGLEACQAAARRVLQGNGVEALKTFLQKQPATPTQRRDGPANANEVHSVNYTTKGLTHSFNLLSSNSFKY